MSVAAYGAGALGVERSTTLYRSIKDDLATYQAQLSTGQVATTFSGLGAGAATSLGLRSRLSASSEYLANAGDARLRVALMSTGLARIEALGRSLVTSASGPQTPGQSDVAVSAADGLQQIIEALNVDVGGRYLFAGRASDTRPVAPFDLLVDGDADHAGLRTLVAERKAADTGADGLGRLSLATTGATVTLAETAGLPFGLKLDAATASGANVTASLTAGPPASLAVDVAAQPSPGEALSVTFNLPDGTQATIRVVAGSLTGDGYAVGATPAATAANLATALGDALRKATSTTLAAASAMVTSQDFFGADANNPPLRVVGTPPETATSLAAGSAGDTVIWYRGDTSADPRAAAPVRLGESRTIGIGAAANEPELQAVLAAFGALAADAFPASDPNATARRLAMSERISTVLGGRDGKPLLEITTDLAIASGAIEAASERQAVTRNQIEDALAEIETADPTEAATKLLATQTRLQATYQTTSTLLKLSLVDYL